jgi:hypothetical protein
MGRLPGQLTLDVWRSLRSALPSAACRPGDLPGPSARLVRRYDPVPCQKREAA